MRPGRSSPAIFTAQPPETCLEPLVLREPPLFRFGLTYDVLRDPPLSLSSPAVLEDVS